jgi:uncharacterized membrane protein
MADRLLKAFQMGSAMGAALLLGACSEQSADGITTESQPYNGIAAEEVITLTGTEPFWGITIENDVATYSDPENPEGSVFEVSRFAGNNGLGFSGKLDGAAVIMTVTPGECSDGMSDRTFPFTATIALGEDKLVGCGYTDRQPFSGDAAP